MFMLAEINIWLAEIIIGGTIICIVIFQATKETRHESGS
jgi:hypothetical protein